ncbi:hypothetical protein F4777DRAFT_564120 [Nemania sp. FL0916]|nr:hypothetical protein F4777DRAFT_564120 [Nemania sp. FL0916]
MGIIPILAEILDALKLAKKIKEALDKLIPPPPQDLKDKHRWMQITLKNATQFPLLLDQTYFDSGRYWTAPAGSSAFDQNVFSVCNKDHSPVTGASGGTSFQIVLDKTHTFNIALGWTAPEAGRFKAGVIESTDPKDGYNAASPTGNFIISQNEYEGTDKEGNPTKIYFHVSAAPGNEAMFVVTEVKLE